MTRETIHYATTPYQSGTILIAQSDQGLCALLIDPQPQDLQSYFPTATLVENPDALQKTIQEVISHIADPAKPLTVKLDIRGTAFQKRVWEGLLQIPCGGVTTYGALAHGINAPKAVRAVGTACGANKIAILIPCHRVIGANGKLTGYRWGLAHKEALLENERKR